MKLAIESLLEFVSVAGVDDPVEAATTMAKEALADTEYGAPSEPAWALVRKHQCDLSLNQGTWSVRAWAVDDKGKSHHGIAKDESVSLAVMKAVHQALEKTGLSS